MPFYKRNDNVLMYAPNAVLGPALELLAENHAEYTYPADGWVWADTLDEAMSNPLLREQVQSVTMRQARRALNQRGLLATVESAIDALPEAARADARIEWEYSSEVQRHNGFVAALVPMLGLSETDVDNLFALAATL